jgi:phosphotriesterase-related protein
LQQIELLKEKAVDPSAFVWVHAQAEKDKSFHQKAAAMKSWISLDGIGWGDHENYSDSIERLKKAGLIQRVLISHDAGWYKPDEPEAPFTGFTDIFRKLIPLLQSKGFSGEDLDQLLVKNPWEAFAIGIKKL